MTSCQQLVKSTKCDTNTNANKLAHSDAKIGKQFWLSIFDQIDQFNLNLTGDSIFERIFFFPPIDWLYSTGWDHSSGSEKSRSSYKCLAFVSKLRVFHNVSNSRSIYPGSRIPNHHYFWNSRRLTPSIEHQTMSGSTRGKARRFSLSSGWKFQQKIQWDSMKRKPSNHSNHWNPMSDCTLRTSGFFC